MVQQIRQAPNVVFYSHLSFAPYGVLYILCVADLQLDVKGCADVYASFDKYVEVERLEGDNKYHAEQYGLQVRQHTSLAVPSAPSVTPGKVHKSFYKIKLQDCNYILQRCFICLFIFSSWLIC